MKQRLLKWFLRFLRRKSAPDVIRDQNNLIRVLTDRLLELEKTAAVQSARNAYFEMVGELNEAIRMAGAGPWSFNKAAARVGAALGEAEATGNTANLRESLIALRETNPTILAGAFGDIELALQNVEWKREVQLSWLEFSRWGIQQIILISRLYYIKNPICRRLVDVSAAYVFARGVEVSTADEDANQVLEDFFEENKAVLGHTALVELERRKDYDGNLFFVFFPDRAGKGTTRVRTIDATEIQEIISDPQDSDTPWFYKRVWTQWDTKFPAGTVEAVSKEAWYPSINYLPDDKTRPTVIGDKPVMWESPVYHRKCGGVAKWKFGCPRMYPMLDWAKEARRYLEACMAIRQALSQFALIITSKGGQQALAAIKSQLETTIGPSGNLWDNNPPTVQGGAFASGPGTSVEAFKTQGAGFDPEGVRQYKLMCCMVKGLPETFLADVSTGNLATATSLDRPTETVFMECQEAWVEDLTMIALFVLRTSFGAASGVLREGLTDRNIHMDDVTIRACRRDVANHKYIEAQDGDPGDIRIQVNFPAIREGDIPALVKSVVDAVTLGDTTGGEHGIDIKTAVKLLFRYLGVEDGDELAEKMYPDADYEMDRTQEEEPEEPPTNPLPTPAPAPAPKESRRMVKPTMRRIQEAVRELVER